MPKFRDQGFLESLPSLGQNWVPAYNYLKDHPHFAVRNFYLFDFVACFVDPSRIFDVGTQFSLQTIGSKYNLLDRIGEGDSRYQPFSHSDNVGWDPLIRGLGMSLPGETQVSFLKVVLFFSVRKVTTRAKLEAALQNASTVMKSVFLEADETIQIHFQRPLRLNRATFANNKKIWINQEYAENSVSQLGSMA